MMNPTSGDAQAREPVPTSASSVERSMQRMAAIAPASASEPPATLAALRQLVQLRGIAIIGQTIAIGLAMSLGVQVSTTPMLLAVLGLVAVNLRTRARLKHGGAVRHREIGAHLALDLGAFTALLLLAGGTANPFALVYLLHVVLIAMLLPWRLAVAGTILVVASAALAWEFAEPLRYTNGETLSDLALTLGLWASVTVTSAVTAWFVVRISATLREHDRLLNEAARQALNDEAVLRMGTLAAGAAHELATPLTTMSVVVGEMRRSADTPERSRDAEILAAQIDACKQALRNLRAAASHARADETRREPADSYLGSVVARFEAMRPGIPVAARWSGSARPPEIMADAGLAQAILILLNNAADASPHHVDIQGSWDADALNVVVGDRGTGVAQSRIEQLGRAFFTTKAPGQGTGLGLVLAASTVSRLGGTLRWANRAGGGLHAELRIPLRSLDTY